MYKSRVPNIYEQYGKLYIHYTVCSFVDDTHLLRVLKRMSSRDNTLPLQEFVNNIMAWVTENNMPFWKKTSLRFLPTRLEVSSYWTAILHYIRAKQELHHLQLAPPCQ